MTEHKKGIAVIIPAKSDSKRLHNKNIALVDGKPLLFKGFPKEGNEADCNCYTCKSDYGNCVTKTRNEMRAEIIKYLEEKLR